MNWPTRSILARSVAVLLAATSFMIPTISRAASDQAEARVRAIVHAFASGDSGTFERAAQEHYTAAALARRTASQRTQSLAQIVSQAGAFELTEIRADGNKRVATARAARGGSVVFTCAISADPGQRIETVSIQVQGVPALSTGQDPYAPYAFLVGEWETTGGIHQSIRWGPGKSYLWFAVLVGGSGGAEEHLHQEGLMTFNGKDKDLDFLFVHEPGSLNQEQGKVHLETDGSVLRETTAISGDGTVNHFRQTWRSTGPNTAVTSLLRQGADGNWSPNFPGSEKLEMTRRTK